MRRPPLLDVVLAGGLFVLGELEAAFAANNPHRIIAAVFALPMTLPVAYRRIRPIPVAAIVLSAFAAQTALGVPGNSQVTATVVWIVMAYTVAAYCELVPAIVGITVPALGMTVISVIKDTRSVSDVLFIVVVITGAPWALGRIVRVLHVHNLQLIDDAARAEAESEERARLVLERERQRIARELHDIIAHGLSLMVLQAGAAEEVLRRSPERAAAPLRTIQETGRQSLADMKRLLEVLRSPDTPAGTAPQPGLDDIAALVTQVRDAGLDVSIEIDGDAVTAAPGVGLSVYRVVQEALTNVRKHAPGARASVTIGYSARAITVDVVDDGAGTHVNGKRLPSPGHGLIGMRERVALYGGEFRAGRGDGGFAVHARFPIEPVKVTER
jgi:signal transduction histidine kinase